MTIYLSDHSSDRLFLLEESKAKPKIVKQNESMKFKENKVYEFQVEI